MLQRNHHSAFLSGLPATGQASPPGMGSLSQEGPGDARMRFGSACGTTGQASHPEMGSLSQEGPGDAGMQFGGGCGTTEHFGLEEVTCAY